jgi:hypothetical protein
MLRAYRPLAVRSCLLIVTVVLSSVIVLALGASADPSRAGAASLPAVGLSGPVGKSANGTSANGKSANGTSANGTSANGKSAKGKSSSSKRTKCIVAAHANKHRKTRRLCAGKKSNPKASKPSVARKWPALVPPLLSEPSWS